MEDEDSEGEMEVDEHASGEDIWGEGMTKRKWTFKLHIKELKIRTLASKNSKAWYVGKNIQQKMKLFSEI